MPQSLLELPDMEILVDPDTKMVVERGRVGIHQRLLDDPDVENQGEENWVERYESMAEYFLSSSMLGTPYEDKFLEKLESHISHEQVVEHCARELEDPHLLKWILRTLDASNQCLHGSEYSDEGLADLLKRNMITDEGENHVLFSENDNLRKELNIKNKRVSRDILEKSGIQEHLISMFRDSESYAELAEKMRGDKDGSPRSYVKAMIQYHENTICDILKEYVRKNKEKIKKEMIK